MSRKGILVVVSGFSGAGKGTLMKELLKSYDNYALSVSATTRSPREGEVHGREYFFVTRDHFLEMIDKGELYEYAEYAGNYYGTPKQYVDDKMEEGKDVILEIEVQGAEKIKKQFPDTVLIFVTPPNVEVLRNRLIGRGSETAETLKKRLSRAVEEVRYMPFYDYIIVNDDLEHAARELHAVICSEHLMSKRNQELIMKISDELHSSDI